MSFIGDDSRWVFSGDHRSCSWCSNAHQIETTVQVERRHWVSAPAFSKQINQTPTPTLLMTMTKKPDYTAFDEQLLGLIKAGTKSASALTIELLNEAKPFASRTGEEFRVVDRRLQALRKKGVIKPFREGLLAGWSLTKN